MYNFSLQTLVLNSNKHCEHVLSNLEGILCSKYPPKQRLHTVGALRLVDVFSSEPSVLVLWILEDLPQDHINVRTFLDFVQDGFE